KPDHAKQKYDKHLHKCLLHGEHPFSEAYIGFGNESQQAWVYFLAGLGTNRSLIPLACRWTRRRDPAWIHRHDSAWVHRRDSVWIHLRRLAWAHRRRLAWARRRDSVSIHLRHSVWICSWAFPWNHP